MLRFRSDEPILVPDREWEADGQAVASGAFVEADGVSVRLYYLVRFETDPLRNVICLARTRDLRHWEKPDRGDGTNVVMRSSGHRTDWGEFMPCRILFDPQDAQVSARWKMLYWDRPAADRPAGFCLAGSPDGLRWTPLFDQPFITNANDAGSMIDAGGEAKDPLGRARFFLYQQTWKYNPRLPTERDNLKGMHRRISVWRTGRLDGHWVGPVTVLEPDEQDPPDMQFYWLTPFHAKGGYGGLLHCHHTADQTMDVQLVVSPDGWSWRRANGRRPVLGLGEKGRFDCGMVYAWSAPILRQGRVLVFYNGRATVHDGQPRYPDPAAPPATQGIGLAEFDQDLLAGFPNA